MHSQVKVRLYPSFTVAIVYYLQPPFLNPTTCQDAESLKHATVEKLTVDKPEHNLIHNFPGNTIPG